MTQRYCKSCSGWHNLDEPWPIECRPARRASRGDFPTPMVIGDIEEYRSPIDGKLITSRSQRREDLKANDCIPWEPGIGTTDASKNRTPGKYKNPKFAKKRNLPMSDEGRVKASQMREHGEL